MGTERCTPRHPRGEGVRLVGPNGSGKTTFLRVVATLIAPNRGTVRVAGHDTVTDYRGALENIGFVPESFGAYPEATAEEQLHLWRSFYDAQGAPSRSVDGLIGLVGLEEAREKQVSEFSSGMRRRLAIAQSLLGDPSILLLDEPFNALDLDGAFFLRGLVRDLRQRGLTVVLSSHLFSEIDSLCDSVAVFDHGVVLGVYSVDLLREEAIAMKPTEVRIDLEVPDGAFVAALSQLPFVSRVAMEKSTVTATLDPGRDSFDLLLRSLTEFSGKGKILSIRPVTLPIEKAVSGLLARGGGR